MALAHLRVPKALPREPRGSGTGMPSMEGRRLLVLGLVGFLLAAGLPGGSLPQPAARAPAPADAPAPTHGSLATPLPIPPGDAFPPSSLPASAGSVNYTLDLMDGHLLPGNPPLPRSCPTPTDSLPVPSRNEILVTCGGGDDHVVLVNRSTGQLIASIPVGAGPTGVAYDSANGHAYVTNTGSDNVSDIDLATQSVVASIVVDLSPDGVVYDTGNTYLYVTNTFSNNVSVISTSTNQVVKTLAAGAYPKGITYDSGNGYLYVADHWPIPTATVTVIDGTTNTVVATLPVGAFPSGIAYDWGNGDVYVANSGSNNVTVISAATDSVVGTIAVGVAPAGVAYDSTDGRIYVANSGSNNVTVISDVGNTVVASVPVGSSPQGVEYDSGNGRVYAADSGSEQLSVLDAATATVISTLPLGLFPQALAYDSGNGDVYVANRASDNVTVVSGSTNSVIASPPVGSLPDGMGYDPGNGGIYVADGGSNEVSVINGTTNTVVATIPVGAAPQGVGYDLGNGEIYVANSGSNSVSVINGSTNTVVASAPVGYSPWGVLCAGGYVFVTDSGSGNVSILNATTLAPVSSLAVGLSPEGIAYDAGEGTAYVANSGSGNVSVLSTVTHQLLATLPAASPPAGVGYDGTNGNVFLTEPASGTVEVLSGNLSLGSLAVGAGAAEVAFDAGNGYAYVTDSAVNALSILVPSTYVPSLSSVRVIPPAASLPMGGVAVLAALPSCANWGCPSGATYLWSLNNTLGNLSSPPGLFTTFTAGSQPGSVAVSVNMTLNGRSAMGAASIRIDPNLTAIQVNPASANLSVGGSLSLLATATCLPTRCPSSGITYAWSLNRTLGTLQNVTGPSATFSAGPTVGAVRVTVNATLHGRLVRSSTNLTITPGLSRVQVVPGTATVALGSSQVFTAVSNCTGGPCPARITYAWSLNRTLGSLNSTVGASVLFTAGPTAGAVNLTVNATEGSQVMKGSGSVTLAPALSSATVSPATSLLAPGGRQVFSSYLSCTGGPCPAGATYAWSLSQPLGSLNASTGPSVTLTAGSGSGSANLTVNVSMDGRWARTSAPVTLSSTLPTLVGVAVSLPIAWVQVGGNLPVNATATCSPGPCPSSGVAYSWRVDSSLGQASPLTGPITTFTAGPTAGTVNLTVTGVLYGLSQAATSRITISATGVPQLTGVTLLTGTAVGNDHPFQASVSCSPGPCPGFVTYQWSANNTLGKFSAPTGPSTTFVGGNGSGLVTVTVVASLDARGVSNSTVISLLPSQPTLVQVTITPSPATVQAGSNLTFRAGATCLPAPACSSHITFAWALDNSLGKVTPLTGNATVFRAGGTGGQVRITVTAALGTGRANASALIHVTLVASGSSILLGLPAVVAYVGMGVIAVALVTLGWLNHRRRKKGETEAPAEKPGPTPAPLPGPLPASPPAEGSTPKTGDGAPSGDANGTSPPGTGDLTWGGPRFPTLRVLTSERLDLGPPLGRISNVLSTPPGIGRGGPS